MTRRRAVALAIAALALGCRAPAAVAPPPESDDGRFPHSRHAGLGCDACHPTDAVLGGRLAPPGHATCDRGGCHRAEFLAGTTPLCAVCHVEPPRPDLLPYPALGGRRALAAQMSHAAHLDAAALERAVGFHLACADCHLDARRALTPPGHEVCARCHAVEAAPPGTPAMTACAGCHQSRARDPVRARRLIVGDLHFDHERHLLDRAGRAIGCAECHTASARSTSSDQHAPPAIATCVACHDDTDRVPLERRMRVCETCHRDRQGTIGALAPRSHLPELERPEDHTGAFRREHGDEARRRATRCARCHTMMSGSPRDACDECHQVMRPEDHVVTWPELDHGPAAAARPDRCATCHAADVCVACHATPPRSHLPLDGFAAGGHGGPARLNLRACLTCHAPDTCRACHAGGAP